MMLPLVLLIVPSLPPDAAALLAALGFFALGMAGLTKIEWADRSWNPATGCTRVSRGCENCYMFWDVENRLMHNPNGRYVHGTAVTLHPHALGEMARILEPGKVFVNSMSDLFHETIPDEYVFRVFEAMAEAPWHLYMILTKRADRLRELGPALPWADYIMMGVSVEDASQVHRIDALRTSGAIRTFVSFEPLVDSVLDDQSQLDLSGIDYAIVGGESGPKAARMEPAWAREVRDACREQSVAFHFKQWGRFNAVGEAVGKSKAGRELDGHTYGEEPAWLESFMRRSRLLAAAERVRRTRSSA